ncbi:sensor histidine kinase [Bacillus sp. 2205SS5-2]|uniref:sensor histidine kinase n=1 Tax=Bacillus sp. 2205SS5-2 TaxID=3109031 RepID=UPI003005B7E5
MLRYWTTRYLLTLVVGIIGLGLFSGYIVHRNAVVNQLDLSTLLAEEIADRLVDDSGRIQYTPFIPKLIEERVRIFNSSDSITVFLKGENEKIIPLVKMKRTASKEILATISNLPVRKDTYIEEVNLPTERKIYFISVPLIVEDEAVGSVVVLNSSPSMIKFFEQFRFVLGALLLMALLGWGVIYLLTKRLVAPIADVAKSAMEMKEGHYPSSVEHQNVKEKEISDLILSFNEMSVKLQALETLRKELLAGVTHELKTPVTAISALLQAIQDEVVEEEEKAEFVMMSYKETEKLQRMIEDLLDFNTFSSGVMTVDTHKLHLPTLIAEWVKQWRIMYRGKGITFTIDQIGEVVAFGDELRVHQILTNLINNSVHAMPLGGEIIIRLLTEGEEAIFEVKDMGEGIPVQEQPYIFERFYRGKRKKNKIRGLGLGLSFSELLANAQRGSLSLLTSNENGSVFRFSLPVSANGMRRTYE